MSVVTLHQGHYERIGLRIGERQLMRLLAGWDIAARIESERPVDVYVVNDVGKADLEAGRDFSTLFQRSGITRIDERISIGGQRQQVPFNVYVIIMNRSNLDTALCYEVSA